MRFIRQRGLTFFTEAVVNVGLPYAVYSLLKPRYGDVDGLLGSMAPPLLWSIAEFARKRRVDAVSIFVLAGIVLSLLAFFGGGSARFLQLRENLVTGVIALIFLGSAAIGKPLIYQLALAGVKRNAPEAAASFEGLRDNAFFRRGMTVMTLVWGGGLLVQTAVACALVFVMPIGTYLIVSPIFGYGVMGLLALWTLWYSRDMKRRGEARRAQLEAAD